MGYYSRSAEDAFMERQARKLDMPTGDIFEDRARTYAFRCLASLNRIREEAGRSSGKQMPPIRVYPYKGYKKDANDEWKGTDLKLVDYAGIIAPFVGHLRMDFTHNFKKKMGDYMPILADPKEKMTLCGKPVQFGIRVGNSHGMFREPVIVVGIDAAPDEIKGMAETNRFSELDRQMADIIYASGRVLQEFMRQADPSFRAFMDKYPKRVPPTGVALSVNNDSRKKSLSLAKSKPRGSSLAGMVKATVPWSGSRLQASTETPSETPWLDTLNAAIREIDEADKKDQERFDRTHGIK